MNRAVTFFLSIILAGLLCLVFAAFYRPFMALLIDSHGYVRQGQQLKMPLLEYHKLHGEWPNSYSQVSSSLPWTLIGQWSYQVSGPCEVSLRLGGSGFYAEWCAVRDAIKLSSECSIDCVSHGWDVGD